MSEVVAPVAAPAPAVEAAPAAPVAKPRMTTADIIAKVNAKYAEPAPTAPVAPAAEAAPAPAEAPAPQQPGETNGQYATRLSDMLQKLTKAEAGALTQKQRADAAEARAAAAEALIESAKGDPNKLLELGGLGAEALGKLFLEGKLVFEGGQKVKEAELPPDVREAVEYAKQMKAKEEAKEKADAASKLRAESVAAVETSLKAVEGEFPVLAALPGMAEKLTDAIQQLMAPDEPGGEPKPEPDFRTMCAEANKAILGELTSVYSNKASLAEVLKDPAIATLCRELLGAAPAAPAATPAPSTPAVAAPSTLNARIASPVPTRTSGQSSSAEIAARLNAQRANGG